MIKIEDLYKMEVEQGLLNTDELEKLQKDVLESLHEDERKLFLRILSRVGKEAYELGYKSCISLLIS